MKPASILAACRAQATATRQPGVHVENCAAGRIIVQADRRNASQTWQYSVGDSAREHASNVGAAAACAAIEAIRAAN